MIKCLCRPDTISADPSYIVTAIVLREEYVAITVEQLTSQQVQKLLALEEGHFVDLKATAVKPAKLTETLSAFANADGDELYIGIDELKLLTYKRRKWNGFADQEAANGHVQGLERFFPLGQDFDYTFLAAASKPGLVLQVSVRKTAAVMKASDGVVYVRRGAQKLPFTTREAPDGARP